MPIPHQQGKEIEELTACDLGACASKSLGLHLQGGLLILRTSNAKLHLSSNATRIGGLLVIVASACFFRAYPWIVLLVPFGLLLLCRPSLIIRPATYAMVDLDGQKLLRPSFRQSTGINIADIRCVRGVYEVQGWDSRSAFYAVLLDGSEELITYFTGTDDALAESLCLALGQTLNRPSSYTGLFGEVLFRHNPIAYLSKSPK